MIRDPNNPQAATMQPMAVSRVAEKAKPAALLSLSRLGGPALQKAAQTAAQTGLGVFGMQAKDPNERPLLGLQGQLAQRIPTNVPGVDRLPSQTPVAQPAPQMPQPIPAAPTQPQNPTDGIVPPPPVAGVQPIPAAPSGPSPFPQTNPNDPLTGRTLQRTPEQDRFAIAQQRFNTFVESTDPQYKAALRDANRYGAATGRLGSGDLRTDFGNLAQQRDLQMRTAQQGFLQDALTGTIEDQFRDLGVAQQQQGFQNQQQQQAFENELRRLGFTEDMINSAFGRSLQTYMAGQAGGTGSGTQLQFGQNQFNQGSDALTALNALIRGNPGPAPVGTPPIAGGTLTRWPWQTSTIPEGAA